MKEELCYDNYKRVEDILGRYDSKLGELFHRISKSMMEELCYGHEEKNGGMASPIQGRDLDDVKQMEANGVNIIPSEGKGSCHENCVVLVNGEWKNKKNSFLNLSKTLVRYWLECFNINKRTLVLTTVWDEKSFNRLYKKEYDSYANDHSIVVVLLTSTGPSIQYIGK